MNKKNTSNKLSITHVLIILIGFLFISVNSNSQSLNEFGKSVIDSLSNSLEKLQQKPQSYATDTCIVKNLNAIAWEFKASNPDTSIILSAQALALSEKQDWLPGIANSNHNLGEFNSRKGNYETALLHCQKAIEVKEKLNDRLGLAKTLGNMGNIYQSQGNYAKALECNFKSLREGELLGHKLLIAVNLGNIGEVYLELGEYRKALNYFLQSLKRNKAINRKRGIGIQLNNIGKVYVYQGKYSEALVQFMDALEVNKELNYKNEIAVNLSSIGSIYLKLGDYTKSLEYYFNALKIAEDLGDKKEIAANLEGIGTVYMKQMNYSEAEHYLQKALIVSSEIGELNCKKDVHQKLSRLYQKWSATEKTSEYLQNALDHYKNYSRLKDSIFSEEKTKKSVRAEMNFEFNKKQALAEEELKRQKVLSYAVIGGFLLVLIIAVIIFRSLKAAKLHEKELDLRNRRIEAAFHLIENQKTIVDKKNKDLELQKLEIAEKNTAILSSIRYAQRIQNAILPSQKLINQYLPESFILYKPKDIVAGDFYWLEVVNNKILFAVCDCTGHGVAGAFVSIVGHNALNRAVKEFGITEPAKILDKVNLIVEETFSKSDSDMQDGMDIALCSLELRNGIWHMEYAGANNSLYYIENGNLCEVKADKQPIGKFEKRKPFTNQCFELQKNTMIYAFSDGYPDQFGGVEEKKFMYKQVEQVLLDVHKKTMTEQKDLLNDIIEKWRGQLEQVDDICFMGIKIF